MLSMKEEIHVPLFIEPVPAALPLRTRCFQSVDVRMVVGHAYAQTSHRTPDRKHRNKAGAGVRQKLQA